MSVMGPLDNKIVALGMLELGKESINQYYAKKMPESLQAKGAGIGLGLVPLVALE